MDEDTIIPNDNNNGFDFAMWEREGTKNCAEGVVTVWMNEIEIDMNDDTFSNWQFNGKMFA